MLSKLLDTEPALVVAFTTGLVGLLAGLGIISQSAADGYIKAATVLLPTLLPLLAGVIARGHVWSPSSVHQALRAQAGNTRGGQA